MTTTPTTPTSDVLANANPRSLEELMKIDPLALTSSDIGEIITMLRRQRIEWDKVQTIKKTGGTRTEKAAAKKAEAQNLLAELGFDL